MFDQEEVLNAFYKKGKESLLLLILKKGLTIDVVNNITVITVIGNNIDRVFGYCQFYKLMLLALVDLRHKGFFS